MVLLLLLVFIFQLIVCVCLFLFFFTSCHILQAEVQAAQVAVVGQATQEVAAAATAQARTFGEAVARLEGRCAALDAHNARLLRGLGTQVPPFLFFCFFVLCVFCFVFTCVSLSGSVFLFIFSLIKS